jgi:hypothetical protein
MWGNLACNGPIVQSTDFWVDIDQRWDDTDSGRLKTEKILSHCRFCPQIPHGLTWMRTRASGVRGQWQTAWAMARPNVSDTGLQRAVLWNRQTGHVDVVYLHLVHMLTMLQLSCQVRDFTQFLYSNFSCTLPWPLPNKLLFIHAWSSSFTFSAISFL